QAAGKTVLTDSSAHLNAPTVVQGGALQGYGVIGGNLQYLGGQLVPGLTSPNILPGTLTVQGNYTQGAGANLHIFLRTQTMYSSLHVGGAASLAGTLQLDANPLDDYGDPAYGFTPNPGDAFTVLTYASRGGSFSAINGAD